MDSHKRFQFPVDTGSQNTTTFSEYLKEKSIPTLFQHNYS